MKYVNQMIFKSCLDVLLLDVFALAAVLCSLFLPAALQEYVSDLLDFLVNILGTIVVVLPVGMVVLHWANASPTTGMARFYLSTSCTRERLFVLETAPYLLHSAFTEAALVCLSIFLFNSGMDTSDYAFLFLGVLLFSLWFFLCCLGLFLQYVFFTRSGLFCLLTCLAAMIGVIFLVGAQTTAEALPSSFLWILLAVKGAGDAGGAALLYGAWRKMNAVVY